MRVGFILKRERAEAQEIASFLITELLPQHEVRLLEENKEFAAKWWTDGLKIVSESRLGNEIDLLVLLGGDGTLLYASGLVSDLEVPIFGVNLGQLGFMTHFTKDNCLKYLRQAIDKTLKIEERMRLHATVMLKRDGVYEAVAARTAVNDVVLSQRSIARLAEVAVEDRGEPITTYKADGLIVATPTGSTAYCLAAGGPIVSPELKAFVLAPIAPHTLTHRPIVLGESVELKVTAVSDKTTLTIDGQWGCEMATGDYVKIIKAAVPLRLYESPLPFFGILKDRLSWGDRMDAHRKA